MYMCIKLIPALNPRILYTCRMTIALKVCNGNQNCF